MDNRPSVSSPLSRHDDFLFALICEEANGMRLSVLSAPACAVYPKSAIEVLRSTAVIEVKSSAFNKGTGIRNLMMHPPFRGRRPVFIGDDITNESAFAVPPEFDGVGFSVGRRIFGLGGCFPEPDDVRRWIYRVAEADEADQP